MASGLQNVKDFTLKFFYVMGKALSGELSCPCDRSRLLLLCAYQLCVVFVFRYYQTVIKEKYTTDLEKKGSVKVICMGEIRSAGEISVLILPVWVSCSKLMKSLFKVLLKFQTSQKLLSF